jgi:hypothetical protein
VVVVLGSLAALRLLAASHGLGLGLGLKGDGRARGSRSVDVLQHNELVAPPWAAAIVVRSGRIRVHGWLSHFQVNLLIA